MCMYACVSVLIYDNSIPDVYICVCVFVCVYVCVCDDNSARGSSSLRLRVISCLRGCKYDCVCVCVDR